jgi:hypothetical protein
MSTSPLSSPNVPESFPDPSADAWNEGLGHGAGGMSPALLDTHALLGGLATLRDEPTSSAGAAEALENVGTVTLERFIGLAAPMMTMLGIYSVMAGTYEVLGTFSKGDIGDAMYRFGLIGASAQSLFKVMLGVSLITFAQITTRRRWLSLTLAILFGLLGVTMFAVAPLFVLDSMQARPNLPAYLTGKILVASTVFVTAFLVGASITFGGCAWTLRKHFAFLASDKHTIAKAWAQ